MKCWISITIIDPDFTYKNFTIEEQNKILKVETV